MTKEVILSKAIRLLSLNVGSRLWAKEALNISENGRLKTKEEIGSAGFDIRVESMKLEERYIVFDK